MKFILMKSQELICERNGKFCIHANLRFITWETVFQKALKTVSSIRGQSTVLETKGSVANEPVTVYTIHSCNTKQDCVITTPYKIQEGCYLLRRSD